MTEIQNTADLTILDFSKGECPGIYKLIKGFDESIMKKVMAMQVITTILHDLNDLIGKISEKVKANDLAGDWSFQVLYYLNIAANAGMILMMPSISSFNPQPKVEKEGLAKIFQMVRSAISSLANKNGQMGIAFTLGMMKASFILDKARYTTASMKLQSNYSQLTPVIDSSQGTMDSNSQTISAEMKAIKTMIEKDFTAKTRRLYYKH